ncbi:hypothetical protein [Streptomyces sp. 4F14]|uniref:hypothetical protein n=1 Tax=Streptomyces sp. 4F14 TaxID=3394380 RepID=UPI003A897593
MPLDPVEFVVVAVLPQEHVRLQPHPHVAQAEAGQQARGGGHVLQQRGGPGDAVGDPYLGGVAGGIHQRRGPPASGLELAVLRLPRRGGGQYLVPYPLDQLPVQTVQLDDLTG